MGHKALSEYVKGPKPNPLDNDYHGDYADKWSCHEPQFDHAPSKNTKMPFGALTGGK